MNKYNGLLNQIAGDYSIKKGEKEETESDMYPESWTY